MVTQVGSSHHIKIDRCSVHLGEMVKWNKTEENEPQLCEHGATTALMSCCICMQLPNIVILLLEPLARDLPYSGHVQSESQGQAT